MQSRDRGTILCNLEIVGLYCAISRSWDYIVQSRDRGTILCNLEFGMQSWNSENVQQNLTILRLHGAYTSQYFINVNPDQLTCYSVPTRGENMLQNHRVMLCSDAHNLCQLCSTNKPLSSRNMPLCSRNMPLCFQAKFFFRSQKHIFT